MLARTIKKHIESNFAKFSFWWRSCVHSQSLCASPKEVFLAWLFICSYFNEFLRRLWYWVWWWRCCQLNLRKLLAKNLTYRPFSRFYFFNSIYSITLLHKVLLRLYIRIFWLRKAKRSSRDKFKVAWKICHWITRKCKNIFFWWCNWNIYFILVSKVLQNRIFNKSRNIQTNLFLVWKLCPF